jgi:hypothetical protein
LGGRLHLLVLSYFMLIGNASNRVPALFSESTLAFMTPVSMTHESLPSDLDSVVRPYYAFTRRCVMRITLHVPERIGKEAVPG